MQPLGGSIERRGQPAWSRADHNHVAQVALFDSGVQSKAGSRFGIGRIAQGDRSATDQDRNVSQGYSELVKNRLDFRIDLDIKIGVRLAVASKEFSQTQRVARMVLSNQYRVAYGVGDEVYTTQQKCIQEYLPQRSISLHDVAQISAVDFKECAGFHCPAADQSPPPREQVHVAGEFSATQNMEDGLAIGGDANHFDAATQYDVDAVMQISRLQNNFLCLRVPPLAELCKLSSLPGIQLRKHRLGLFRRFLYQFTRGQRHFLSVQFLPLS